MFELTYRDEDDRAYGLAGMAISLASLDALDRIDDIFLDAEGPMVNFNSSYYIGLTPNVSPKSVWNHLLSNLHLTTSLVMSNVMARALVGRGLEPTLETVSAIRDLVREEGSETCGLDQEETDILFERVVNQSRRLFMNPRLHPAVRELAVVLSQKRRLSAMELAEELDLLRL